VSTPTASNFAAQLRIVLVTHDREEPGFQIRAWLEALDIVEGAHQRFLNQVVRRTPSRHSERANVCSCGTRATMSSVTICSLRLTTPAVRGSKAEVCCLTGKLLAADGAKVGEGVEWTGSLPSSCQISPTRPASRS